MTKCASRSFMRPDHEIEDGRCIDVQACALRRQRRPVREPVVVHTAEEDET